MQTPPPPPPLDEYAALIRTATTAARRGDRIEFDTAVEQLLAIHEVRVTDDALVRVDNRWLAEATAGANPDLVPIAERLGAISDTLAQPAGAAPPDALARLDAIMGQPPLSRPEPQPPPQWLIDLLELIGRILDRMLEPITTASPQSANLVAWVIAVIGLVLLVGVIIYMLIGLRRGVVRDTQVADPDPDAGIGSRGALDRAGDHAASGDYRTGMRYLYLSALLWLDEHGALRYDRALTNYEHLAQLNERPELRRRLAPVIETFDRVWYGHAPLDETAFSMFRGQIEQLRRDAEVRQ
ncbi:MAG TPA: DUF4129 domain-containing protein [Roseiflexaceae bacterium]|nr:DUF4129 domain-containing protein [Roseiflexaceae bacterium]